MGGALAIALSRKGYSVAAIASRSKKSARSLAEEISGEIQAFGISQLRLIPVSDVILITTPDSEIAATAERLSKFVSNESVVLHTSGSLSSEELIVLREAGCAVGSMHPLASISEPRAGVKRFAGAYFCIEGDASAVKVARQTVKDLRGNAFTLETKFKPLYHAAAVMTSGHTTALFSTAVETLTQCGLSSAEAQKILLPLLVGTVGNLEKQTPAKALTGTFARADVAAFERHLKALAADADAKDVYLLLGKISLDLAEENGADKEQVEIIRRKIKKAKSK